MIRILIYLIMFLFLIKADANVIHTVYFQAADRPPPTKDDIRKAKDIMHKTQVYYLQEMKRHGYGAKTFNLERDDAGQIVINIVKGKHNWVAYSDPRFIIAELPVKIRVSFKEKNKICVVFLAGVWEINGARGQAARQCWGKTCGHLALIPTIRKFGLVWGPMVKGHDDIDHINLLVTLHEIGHTFGLDHNFNKHPDAKSFVMAPKLTLNQDKPFDLNDYIFDADEAEMLNNHHFLIEGYRDVSPNMLTIKTWGDLKRITDAIEGMSSNE